MSIFKWDQLQQGPVKPRQPIAAAAAAPPPPRRPPPTATSLLPAVGPLSQQTAALVNAGIMMGL